MATANDFSAIVQRAQNEFHENFENNFDAFATTFDKVAKSDTGAYGNVLKGIWESLDCFSFLTFAAQSVIENQREEYPPEQERILSEHTVTAFVSLLVSKLEFNAQELFENEDKLKKNAKELAIVLQCDEKIIDTLCQLTLKHQEKAFLKELEEINFGSIFFLSHYIVYALVGPSLKQKTFP